jgi:hypothetical protein
VSAAPDIAARRELTSRSANVEMHFLPLNVVRDMRYLGRHDVLQPISMHELICSLTYFYKLLQVDLESYNSWTFNPTFSKKIFNNKTITRLLIHKNIFDVSNLIATLNKIKIKQY